MIQEDPATHCQGRVPFAKGILHVPISLVGKLFSSFAFCRGGLALLVR